jgi:hypothetical protein
VDAAQVTRNTMAARLGWVTSALFLLLMAAGADHPPPPGFVLLVGVAVMVSLGVRRLVPPLLRLWDAGGAVPALARAAVVGFGCGAILGALAAAFQLATRSDRLGLVLTMLGIGISGAVTMIGAIAVAATGRLLDRHARRAR